MDDFRQIAEEGTYTIKGKDLSLPWQKGYNAALQDAIDNLSSSVAISREQVILTLEGMFK
jgi:hypothetical protein